VRAARDSVLQVPTLSLLAVIVMRVAALYRGVTWVVTGLWTVWALLWAIAVALGVLTMESFYSQPIPLGS
jgi:hypothetical protein